MKFEISVYAEAPDNSDIKTLQEFLESQKFDSSQERVELSTQMWKKMSSKNFLNSNRSEITLLNDKKITLSDFEREATLTIPESAHLILESKYSTLSIDDIHKFELKSYNDKVYGGDIRQPAKIEAKYSKMEFEETKDLTLDIYDCTFEAGKSEITTIKSRYSNIEIGSTSTLSIESYDDKFEIEKTGDISINTKYSDFILGECGNMALDLYDSNVEIEQLKDLAIKESKYSEIEFEEANNIRFYISYDDIINASSINSIEIGETKYSSFEINMLKNKMTINGYDDNILINELGDNFELFDADIKYGKIYIGMPDNISLELDVKIKYGKLNFDKETFDTKIHIHQDDELEYKGIRGRNSNNLPKIKVRGYDLTFTLED